MHKYCKLHFVIALFVLLCFCPLVNGFLITSDLADVYALSPNMVTCQASGQGTHANFRDISSEDMESFHVSGGNSVENKWVQATWGYYASGFPAEFPEEGNIFCGVFATAWVTHSALAFDGPKSGYVFDGVSAQAKQTFDISIGPIDDDAPQVPDFPITIKVNALMEVSGTSGLDMGNCKTIFSLEEHKPGPTPRVLYSEMEYKADVETGDPILYEVDEMGLTKLESGKNGAMAFVFQDVKLKPATIYRASLYILAGAYSTSEPEDVDSESLAFGYLDPSFSFSPDFEFEDEFALYISPGTIKQSSEKTSFDLEITQDGQEVESISTKNGLVSIRACGFEDSTENSYFIWGAMDPHISDLDGTYSDSCFVFDPTSIDSDSQTINVVLLSSNEPISTSISIDVLEHVENTYENEIKIEIYLIVLLAGVAILTVLFFVKKRK